MAWREAVARTVRDRRTALGLSQQRLAEQVGCDRQTINRVENAQVSPPVDRWHKIATDPFSDTGVPAPDPTQAAVVNEVMALLNRLGYTVAWDGSASALEAAALIGSLDITPREPGGKRQRWPSLSVLRSS
jgi:transcriptional regulator with XRE-family HTH domain